MSIRKSITAGCGADGVAIGLFLAGIFVRVARAWAGRALSDPDSTVVGLMARHMAAGTDFPIFFYGQTYMGSLEAMISAGLLRLLGCSGFVVSLGTVLCAVAALWFLWRWGRDAAGAWGGVAALTAGLFGPVVYFQFQAAPRGGYMAGLAAQTVVLWGVARLATCWREGKAVRLRAFAGLGLVAGLGLWSHLMVVPAVGVAAVLLTVGARGRLHHRLPELLAGVAGTLLGVSPWLWDMVHRGTASIVTGTEPVALEKVFGLLWTRFVLFMDGGQVLWGARVGVCGAVVAVGLACWGVGVAVAQGRRASTRENMARAGAVLLWPLFTVVYMASSFPEVNTGRYWIPLAPVLALLGAVACAARGSIWRRRVAWGVLLAWSAVQGALCVTGMSAAATRNAQEVEDAERISAYLLETGVDSVLAPLQLYTLNFHSDERLAVSDGRKPFYRPILRAAELSDAVSYCTAWRGVGSFLALDGAASEKVSVGGWSFIHHVRRKVPACEPLKPAEIASLRDAVGRDVFHALTDANASTWWSDEGHEGTLEWRFRRPVDLSRLLFQFNHPLGEPDFNSPDRMEIEVSRGEGWSAQGEEIPFHQLEWSGPRVYVSSPMAHAEFRMEMEGITGLRIRLSSRRESGAIGHWRLSEAVLFTPVTEEGAVADRMPLSQHPSEEQLRALEAYVGTFLQDPNMVVYAPRWLSNRLAARGEIPAERLGGLNHRAFPAGNEASPPGEVRGDRGVLFIVEAPYNDPVLRTLSAQALPGWTSEEVPPYGLHYVRPGGWRASELIEDGPLPVVWTGYTLLQGNDVKVANAFRERWPEEDAPTHAAFLQLLAEIRPKSLAVFPEEFLRKMGGEELVALRRRYAVLPERIQPVEFKDGITLMGVDVTPSQVRPGETVAVDLYWRTRGLVKTGLETTFIHLCPPGKPPLAQADYVGIANRPGQPDFSVPLEECVRETRKITLPATTPAGPLPLNIGLYHPTFRTRTPIVSSEADLMVKNAAIFTNLLTVLP